MATADFERFNEIFPGSQYRKIHEQYTGVDRELYQAAKSPINKQIYTFDDVKDYSGRIGWIIPRGFIVVDIDDKKSAEAVIKILTSEKIGCCIFKGLHGGHFIFKASLYNSQVVSKLCALGIKLDTRAAEKGYIILPENDTDREWFKVTEYIDVLPQYLIPLRDLKVDVDFVDMSEGSRNTELFKHFLNLKDYVSEIDLNAKILAIRIINKYLFTHPLSDDELDQTVLRETLIAPKGGRNSGKMDLEALATKICEDYTFITVNDVLYVYDGKCYIPKDDMWIQRIIHENYARRLFDNQRKEVVKFVKMKTYIEPNKLNSKWDEIVCRNGILNIKTLTLRPHNKNEYNTTYVDWNWTDRPPVSRALSEYLDYISNSDTEKEQVILEMIGECFLRKNFLSRFYMIYGTGCTGKSTLLRIIGTLVGNENVSNLSFNDLEEQFLTNELSGKLANLGDDINFKGLTDTSILKKLVTGETMTVNRKFMTPVKLANFATLIFTTNQLPPVSDKTTGFYRRLMIIDVNKPIESPNPLFEYNLDEVDYNWLFVTAIKAISRILNGGVPTTCTSSEMLKRRYMIDQSPVRMFLADTGYDKRTINKMPCKVCYEEFVTYCMENGFRQMTRTNFQNEVCQVLDIDVSNTTRGSEKQCMRFICHGL